MYYNRRRRNGGSFLGIALGLILGVMLIQALVSAVITLGIIVGVVGGVALAFPVVRAMLTRKIGPTPLQSAGTALMRVVRNREEV
jgi:hypothetical protein